MFKEDMKFITFLLKKLVKSNINITINNNINLVIIVAMNNIKFCFRFPDHAR